MFVLFFFLKECSRVLYSWFDKNELYLTFTLIWICRSAKVLGEADVASKPAAKKALPARPFFGEKRMFQYLKLVEPASDGSQGQQTPKRRELDKRRLRNERDLWSEFFQHLKEEFAASICFSLEDVQGFISDCVRAVTFDWIPVASGVQLLQFVLESPHQHRWTCDCLNDKLLEKKPEGRVS